MDSDSDNDDGSVDNQLDDGASDIVFGEASSDEELYTEDQFITDLPRVRDNDPNINVLDGDGSWNFIQNITNEEWEEIGRDISNNTHLKQLYLYDDALNDDKASHLFRGLTSSSSIEKLWLHNNELSKAGVRSMVPVLQHANNLQVLEIGGNNIQSDGFNFLLRALRDSPIERLGCGSCGIESIQIDNSYFPKKLKMLSLYDNNINVDGCRGVAKLLQGGDSTIEHLNLNDNKIDDERVAILADALRSNSSLTYLGLERNDGITKEGLVMLLKLVNDISSVKATLQSHNALKGIRVMDQYSASDKDNQIQTLINTATAINVKNENNAEAAGREKVIQSQLDSRVRDEFAELQGVRQSVYSEISPLHLPDVLSLVGRRHGQGELYVALKSSIAGLISTVNRRECIVKRLADLAAESEKLKAELAKIDAAAGCATHVDVEIPGNKRRRKW